MELCSNLFCQQGQVTNEVVIKKQETSCVKQANNQNQLQNQQQSHNQHGSILVAQLSGKNVRVLIVQFRALFSILIIF